ncbi:MAG: hypothetical protein ACOC4I_02225 [Spirochaetota bacterium]
MKRRAYLSVLIFITASASLAATDLVVLERDILPNEIRVGEPGELRIRVITPADEPVEIPSPFPQTQWVEVTSARIIDRDNETEIVVGFRAYRTGVIELPEFDLGSATLDTGEVRIESVLPTGGVAPIRPVRGPLFAPGSQVFLLLLIILFVAAPFLLYRGSIHAGKHIRSALSAWKENQPYRRIMRVLRTMHMRFDTLNPRIFYIALIDETRVYLTRRLGVDAITATASEVPLLIRGKIADEERVKQLASIFRQADLVKFAGASSDKDKRFRHLIVLAEIVAFIEQKSERTVAHRSQRTLRRGLVRLTVDEAAEPTQTGGDSGVAGHVER